MNFRIDMPDQQVKYEIMQKNYSKLQANDQLLKIKKSNAILSRFKEGPLNFDPTYKYDDHSDIYDTSKKQRIPAWCDRVLYEKVDKADRSIELTEYNRRENFFSDHRPVIANFNIKICSINKELKEQILQ